MTVASSMSLFPSHQASISVRPPHSILSATLTAKSPQNLLSASSAKNKLGFSIDSLVGDKSPKRDVHSPAGARSGSQSPVSRSPRERSPLFRGRSASPDEYRRSPSPGTDSPPSPASLVRPIPTSGAGLSTQSYLDQLAQLKAFYDSRGAAAAAAAGLAAPPSSTAAPAAPAPLGLGLSLPGLHPAAVLSALPRPPAALPPFLGLPGHPPSLPGHPTTTPLYPWFLNRNRFPGGKTSSACVATVSHPHCLCHNNLLQIFHLSPDHHIMYVELRRGTWFKLLKQ